MTFVDFVIRYEHKFLRNIYTVEELQRLENIQSFKNYYQIFEKYIKICIGLLALLNSCNRHDFLNDSTEDFVEENFPDNDVREIKKYN